jgi:hypothetical protein
MGNPTLPAPHVPSPYQYPLCCGAPTALRVFGWFCLHCRQYLPFREGQGRGYRAVRRRLTKRGA